MNVKAFNDMQLLMAPLKMLLMNLFLHKGKVMKILQTILLILLFQMMEAGKNVVTHLMVLLTVVASDSGKCVDFHVLTKTSNACTFWEKQKKQ